MGTHYEQLTPEERATIMVMRNQHCSARHIARTLHRSASTITRELKRFATWQDRPAFVPAPESSCAYDARAAGVRARRQRFKPRRCSKLPLTTWFLAIHLISQAKTGISALALKRDLGVSYPTAWLLHQKINRAMAGQEAAYLLDGTVQLDDAYLWGERSGGKAGRGSENKVPFVAALSMDAAGGPKHLKLDLVSGFTSQAIGQWAKVRLKPSCVVRSDGLVCFTAVTDAGCTHIPRVVGNLKPKDLPEFKWINTVLGNLKTTLSGAFHALRYKKYGQIYLTAFAYRFNRRFDLRGLVAGLIVDVARSKPVPERVVRWGHAEATF